MKKFIKKIKSNKFLYILSVLIIGVFIILITRVTYAFLAPIINEAQTNVAIKGDTIDEYSLKVGNPLKINATPTTLKENGTNYTTSTTATASLKANSTKNTATYNYYLYFQIDNNTFSYTNGTTPEIILTITSPNGEEVTSIEGLTYGTFNGVSGFDVTTQNGLFNIANNYQITSNSSTTATIHEWIITLTYLNQNYDQSANFGKSMEVNVLIKQNEYTTPRFDQTCDETTLACHVAKLYTGTQGENNIYYHDGKLENGIDDNSYRYAGASESVNNYVCFGSSETTCPTENLYRIIGVIDEKVKLIKYDYATSSLLGTDGDYYGKFEYGDDNYKGNNFANVAAYYWNNSTRTNTWSESLLNKTNLNTNFLNSMGTEWKNKIATTTWKVGGNLWKNIALTVPSLTYQNEIVKPDSSNSTDSATEYNAKIGLIYASDYEFAAPSSAWTLVGCNSDSTYSYSTTTALNWMYMGLFEWTISRMSNYSDQTFILYATGNVEGDYSINGLSKVYNYFAVRPVFNLESSVIYVSGTGTSSDPIRIN